jgi:hypothetical protein
MWRCGDVAGAAEELRTKNLADAATMNNEKMKNATEYVIPTGAARHEPRSGGICSKTQAVWTGQRCVATDSSTPLRFARNDARRIHCINPPKSAFHRN